MVADSRVCTCAMAIHDEPDRETLRRFLAGETSPEESAELLRWAQSQPQFDSRRIWDGIAAEVQADKPARIHLARTSPSSGVRMVVGRSRSWSMRIAAAA